MDEELIIEHEWQQLLKDFEHLTAIELNRTFMQISGYPHYENVCSNILSFFFDPGNEHGLKDLCYRALLECAGEGSIQEALQIDVEREINCERRRLDLLLISDQYVVGIENKIWHHLNNDLGIYAKEIESRVHDKGQKVVKIILSIKEETPDAGFISITYSHFLEKLKSLFGYYAPEANSKYLIYLNDFIKTIEDLQGGTMINSAHSKFFKENLDSIQKLNNELVKYQGILNTRINTLLDWFNDTFEDKRIRPWIWAKSTFVLDFNFQEGVISIDTGITPKGWEATIFPRAQKNKDLFKNILIKMQKEDSVRIGNRRILFEKEINADMEEIKSILEESITVISDSMDK